MKTPKFSTFMLIATSFIVTTTSGSSLPQEKKAVAEASSTIKNPVDPVIIKELLGNWTNELKSTLSILDINQQTGLISGIYRSPSGTSGQAYPVTGWVNTATPTQAGSHVVVVSFSVRWGDIGSVTAWNGYYTVVDQEATIVGQWNLSKPNSDYSWDHILAGQDRFTK